MMKIRTRYFLRVRQEVWERGVSDRLFKSRRLFTEISGFLRIRDHYHFGTFSSVNLKVR